MFAQMNSIYWFISHKMTIFYRKNKSEKSKKNRTIYARTVYVYSLALFKLNSTDRSGFHSELTQCSIESFTQCILRCIHSIDCFVFNVFYHCMCVRCHTVRSFILTQWLLSCYSHFIVLVVVFFLENKTWRRTYWTDKKHNTLLWNS